MVRRCCVQNCTSGVASERQKRESLGLRQLTLFAAPKDRVNHKSVFLSWKIVLIFFYNLFSVFLFHSQENLQKWSVSLDQQIKTNNYVCELHFLDEQIHKFDVIKTEDEEFEFPLAVWRLVNDNVVPKIKVNIYFYIELKYYRHLKKGT